ncbi:MAG: hypothetical protein WBN71_13665, partial [Acidimicrobiia bacterium]
MSEFDTLADLVEVTEKLIPFNRILGVRDCRIDDDGVEGQAGFLGELFGSRLAPKLGEQAVPGAV